VKILTCNVDTVDSGSDSVIADGDFLKTGDSGIVSVGSLPAHAPYDGTHAEAAFPSNITISRCHFGQIGVCFPTYFPASQIPHHS
jgi:hypothetical protein